MKRRNRKLRKAITMVCCALALVAISVGATLAYLTDTEAVKNVFTVGQVGITLDELKTGTDGVAIEPNERISGNRSDNEQYTNKYHLIPGESYTKDPTVHVDADSEDSWIFVKVENGIAAIEAADTATTMTIATQITDNKWTALGNDYPGIYYQAYTKNQEDKDLEVFGSFTLKGAGLVNGDADDGEISIDDYADATVEVTAYAIQMAGFENKPADAWEAGNWN